MLFVFYLRDGRTFKFNRRKHFPEFCSNGSSIYPHIIPKIDQVVPSIVKLFRNYEDVPLFTAVRVNGNDMKILNTDQISSEHFWLLFYPRCKTCKDVLTSEYWNNVKPMLICRDIGGYYLGSFGDTNIVTFEVCSAKENCSITPVASGYDEYTMQIQKDGSAVLSESDNIYIRNC